MSSINSRLGKAESTFSDIGCDDQVYIDAWISYFHGDKGKAFESLPKYKRSKGEFAAVIVNALSRYKNENGHGVPEEIWHGVNGSVSKDNRERVTA